MNERQLTSCASAPFADGQSAEALGIDEGCTQRLIEKGAGHRYAG